MQVVAIRTFISDRLVRRGEMLEVHENYARRNPHLVTPVGPKQNKIDGPDETKDGGSATPPAKPVKPEEPPQKEADGEGGVTVTYKCLECGRDDFKSAQGLAAHKRHCKGADSDGSD